MNHHIIDDMNYYNDSRVRAAGGSWYEKLDTKRMKAYSYLADHPEYHGPNGGPDGDYEEWGEGEDWIPFRWEVCPTCNGCGSHVNPAIDCNGLTHDDFADDPDFAESYFRGDYDMPCNGCGGRRVVPVPDGEKYIERLEKHYRALDEMRAEEMAERRMGA